MATGPAQPTRAEAAAPVDLPGFSLSRTFPGTADQVARARRFVSALVAGSAVADDLTLCTSELVTNAIEHSRTGEPGGHFTVSVTLGVIGVRVEVTDQGGPWAARDDQDGLRGRGLTIVSALAASSGISGDDSGRTAWCLLATTQASG